jgi:hypothetical protein
MSVILAASAYQGREILLSLGGSLRRMPLLLPVPIGGELGGDGRI